MSDMKCPKCGGRLVYWGATGALLKCSQCHFGWGNEELWQELIRTRKQLEMTNAELDYIKEQIEKNGAFDSTHKALDIAVDALKWIAYDENDEQDGLEEFAISQILEKADEAIKQITALEQKE